MSSNPYEAPRALVSDEVMVSARGELLAAPRKRPADRGAGWFGDAWILFREAPGLWIGIWIVAMAILMVPAFIPFVGFIVQTLAMPVLWGGIMIGCEAQRRGQPLEFSHLFAGLETQFPQLMLAGVLYLAAMLVVMVVAVVPTLGLAGMALFAGADASEFAAGGAMLLVALAVLLYLALIVPVVMAIWFAPALIVIDGKPAIEAMKLSFAACLRNIVPFLIYGLLGLLLAVVATIPLLLGWLVLGPLVYISSYTGYFDIFHDDIP
jgi:hypothetical protein